MKNVTITLDEKTAAWVRVHAAKLSTSVSRVVGDMLRARMHDEREYEHAMRRFLARKPIVLSTKGQPYPGREALHDRSGLR
jgi:hypothetical protein